MAVRKALIATTGLLAALAVGLPAAPAAATPERGDDHANVHAMGWEQYTWYPGWDAVWWAACYARGEQGLDNGEWTDYRCESFYLGVRLMVYIP